ncbi:hypothetical protein OG455_32175 [Kitasatospora sp. NBC_01287]|uniref:hypothetical protein n=1 Tax=Kitasatospora sp. NBC_01287 TaxID=2903573 RepID=UPI0022585AFD|nr:hypothetical protein [Kitasatospora sp. NBC_01287]MCX4750120.1 hypothetical protein [Kitasatospora sp. NBC_01287]
MSLAIDIGTRFVRFAHLDAAGRPGLADLEGALPGEGLPVAPGRAGQLVLAEGCAAFLARHGPPDAVVLLCPPAQSAACSQVIVECFGTDPGAFPPPRLLRPAVAVLALLRHDGGAQQGTWAVCELGAAAVEITVCSLAPHRLTVLRTVRRRPHGGYGAAFDDAVTDAVTDAATHAVTDAVTDAGPGGADAASLAALGQALGAPGAGERLDLSLARAELDPARHDDTPVLWLRGREVPAGILRRALLPLREELRQALAEATIDALPTVVVGGAARLAALRRQAGGTGGCVELPGGVDPALAAVLGASLVAAGRVDAADRYPHALVIGTRRVRHGRLTSAELTLCPPGALVPAAPAVFACEGGRPVAVGGAGDVPREVEVWAREADGGRTVRAGSARLPASTPDERFHVGVALALDGTARLVLRPADGGASHEYPLGELPGDFEEVRQ